MDFEISLWDGAIYCSEIEREAYRLFPLEHFGTKGMINAAKRRDFLEKACWHETTPSLCQLERMLIDQVRAGKMSESEMIELFNKIISSQ